MTTALKVTFTILIIVAGVVLMLGVAGILFVRQIHVKESGAGDHKTVNIETPLGNMSVQPKKDLDPGMIGVPIYPGATRSNDKGGAEFQLDAGDFHKEFDAAVAVYFTDDSVDQVREFYEQKFPGWNHKSNDSNGWHIETHDGSRVRSVSVNHSEGHTRIAVASFGAPASN